MKINYIKTHQKGFTLIELLVSVAIIALLSSLVMAALNQARKGARDSQRISSLRELQTGLEFYYDKHSQYPDGDGAGAGGWDTPGDGTFLTALVNEDFMQNHVHDPLADDDTGNLRYHRYAAGDFGCAVERGAFYVMGVADMERSSGAHENSLGWSCPERDWQDEMEFVVGKFEN